MTQEVTPIVQDLDQWRRRLAPAEQYIRDHFRASPDLHELAKTVNLSIFHFHRSFKKAYGEPPKQMITRLQIAEARKLLAETDAPLAELAKQLGFAHQSHFTSRFRQITGTTPSRFRRAERAKNGRPTVANHAE
jgi:AraC-like DNA-binding protein